ncbi:hypothetical protein HN51_037257 [Arachis hypogaea]|uniref:uncharacterized protein LOC110270347 n=1 Tax=Arachis ipaensis TaxID=130454 RepID=UPI000A2B4801|nr:uncharacterized protein LOC110270347 [Arachis ipaensis]XP_025638273.1 uncharacterized protein LOC112733514 [Arachis hypogaea]XP_057752549.1 uncharacterized protein LOC130970472 [Arachis stenosperma]QHO02791.1 uncharacterized protein DS421_13g426790 [Arachis hypogaea]QHO58934.1 uncharacterized protein DS421_3g94810 [Arachis hypogaea]
MKDMPFFLLKNSFGAKMKKGFRTLCNNDGSTSTLNQHNNISSPSKQSSPTLEDLILQLEMEEEMARKAKLNEYSSIRRGRMSCVNNSDILRSARNALNQYPRFSLDGRDAMYRSSFGTVEGRRSVCSERSLGGMLMEEEINDFEREMCLPTTVAGESVVWCKPGVVAKLMGLEAIPVPIGGSRRRTDDNKKREKNKLTMMSRRENLMRRRFERHHELERKIAMEMQQGYNGQHCIMKPVELEALAAGGPGIWQHRRYG